MSVLEWKAPPTRSNAVFDAETLAELRARPGEWALVRVYPGHGTRTPKKPIDIEIQVRYLGGKSAPYVQLYARSTKEKMQ